MRQNKSELKLRKILLQQLPYYYTSISATHGKFNNLIDVELPSKFSLTNLPSLCDVNVFSLNSAQNGNANPNTNFDFNLISSNYYSPHSFNEIKQKIYDSYRIFSVIHNNLRSLQRNFENFHTHVLSELDFDFDIIGISETKITRANEPLLNVHLDGIILNTNLL